LVRVDPGYRGFAIDEVGRALGERTIQTTTAANHRALRWALKSYGPELLWAVEDVRSLTVRLEKDLIDAGQRVVRVPTHLMARTRRSARTPGKSDPLDALIVARVALREDDLPVASHTPQSRELKLLSDRRDDLVQNRTAATQRLLWRIHELDPSYLIKPGALSWGTTQTAVATLLDRHTGLVAELAREELAEVIGLTPTINALGRRITAAVAATAPALLELHGCAGLTAARIIGETADITRFKSEAAFARWAGVAPIPDWSGSTRGHLRPHRGGNRQVNAAIHVIALTQIKKGAPGEQYYRAVRERKGSHGAAFAALKRRITRSVYTRLRAASKSSSTTTSTPTGGP
jgi:transposase